MRPVLDWETVGLAVSPKLWGAGVGDESVGQLRRLRLAARRLGLAIRTERPSYASGSRAYRVIDRATGQAIRADVQDLSGVQTLLWWMVRSRRRALSSPFVVNELPEELCPGCGTCRVGFFRWCLSCRLDYDASPEPAPARAPRVSAREPMTARLAGLAADVRHGYRFAPVRPLAGAAILALLTATIVTLVLTALR